MTLPRGGRREASREFAPNPVRAPRLASAAFGSASHPTASRTALPRRPIENDPSLKPHKVSRRSSAVSLVYPERASRWFQSSGSFWKFYMRDSLGVFVPEPLFDL